MTCPLGNRGTKTTHLQGPEDGSPQEHLRFPKSNTRIETESAEQFVACTQQQASTMQHG